MRIFDNIKIYCFEPDPRAFKQLNENVKDSRAKFYQLAISDKTGEIDFHLSSGWPSDWPGTGEWNMSSSLKKPKNHIAKHPWCKFEKIIKVKTISLDEWVSDNKIETIDFIWADTQGAEGELIRGGLNTLNNKVRYFYTEYSNEELYEEELNKNEILKLLPNFKLLRDFGGDLLLENKKFGYVCKNCGGSGKCPSSDNRCCVCNGTGERKQKILEVLKQLEDNVKKGNFQ